MIILPAAILEMPAGDERSFMEALFMKYCNLMYTIALDHTDSSPQADDIVSESCFALMQNIPTLRTLNDRQLTVYISITAKNTALNLLSKQNRAHRLETEDAEEEIAQVADSCDIEKKIELSDELSRVLSAIRMLPVRQQQILRMKCIANMSDEEISELTGLSVNSIRKYIERARKQLRTLVYKE